MAAARGCGSCRAARVKCDGLRPVCARCSRLGLPCEGYRDAGALIFRDQTGLVGPILNKSRRSSGTAELAEVPSPKPLHVLPRYVDGTGHMHWLAHPISRGLQPKWEDLAVARFLTSYVLESSPQDVHTGYLADLPSFYAQTSPGSLLHYAIVACSFMSFGLQENSTNSRTTAQRIYGSALVKLRTATLDTDMASKDETLLAMLVLDYYALLEDDDPYAVGPHTKGLEVILRLRGIRQLQSATGWNIFRAAHRRMQYRKLLMTETPLEESAGWMAMLNQGHAENANASSIYEASKARRKAQNALQAARRSTPSVESSQEVMAAMAELEAASESLRAWNIMADAPWRLGRTETAFTASASSSTHSSYHDIYVATTWNYNRVGRWLLSEALYDCLSFLGTQSSNQSFVTNAAERMESCRQTVIKEVEANLTAVPFLLGEVDCYGYPIVSPRPRELGKYYAYIGIRPILDSRLCTLEQRQRAKTIQADILRRLKHER